MNTLEAPAGEKRCKSERISRRRKTCRALFEVAIVLVGGLFVASAPAQMTTSTQPGTGATLQDLAKSVHNPFEDFVKVPLQSTTGFSIGPHHNAGESLNVQPVFPFP